MNSYTRINEKTPCGGAYSEIYYFDEDGNPADESKAFRCVIRECDENGELLNETWGNIREEPEPSPIWEAWLKEQMNDK